MPNATGSPDTLADAEPSGQAKGAKLAFVHIPKTAGTSFTRALAAGWPRARIVATSNEFSAINPQEAAGLDLIAGHFFAHQLSRPFWQPFHALTVLRDPRAKLMSSYRYARSMVLQQGIEGTPQMRFAARASFAEYAFSIYGVRDRHSQIYNLATRHAENPHDLPLADLLERAKARLERMEVGTADRLQDFADYLFRRFGRGSAPAVERLNTAEALEQADVGLTTWQDVALRELMRPDEALVGHARALFDARMRALDTGTATLGVPRRAGAEEVPAYPTPVPAAKMLVGTFHKTGTLLMLSVMRRVAHRLGHVMWVRNGEEPPPNWSIWFDAHSRFDGAARERPYRAVVVVRDPRDVVISGAFYHCSTTKPGDAWVDVAQPKLGGRSYRQAITALPDDAARFLFEMDGMAAQTISRMAHYVTPDPHTLVVKFEELVSDTELRGYRRIFDWLGLGGDAMEVALAIARDASIFSGKVVSDHVRSGQPAQWRQHFTPALHAAFRERFGDIAERLGYPPA